MNKKLIKILNFIEAKIVFCIILFCSNIILAQQFKIDSLLEKIPNIKLDSTRVNILNELSFYYWDVNPTEGLKYANQALELSEKLNYIKGIAESYSNLSRSYRRLTNLTKSLEYGFKSLKHYEILGDKKGIAQNLVNIGNTYRVKKDYIKSLEYLQNSLKINEEIKDSIWIARSFNSIGNLYKDLKNYQKSLENYQKSLNIAFEINNEARIAAAFTNLGSIYGLLKNYNKALDYNFKGLEMMKKLGEKIGVSECYLNIASVFINQSIESKSQILLQKAKIYCDSAIITDKNINHLEGLELDYKTLTHILINIGDYKSAVHSMEYYYILRDSISNGESNRKIAQLEKNNEEDLKQKEIEIQKLQIETSQKEKIYFEVGLFLSLLF